MRGNVIGKGVSGLLGDKKPQRRVEESLPGRKVSGIWEKGETDGDSEKKDMTKPPPHKISMSST